MHDLPVPGYTWSHQPPSPGCYQTCIGGHHDPPPPPGYNWTGPHCGIYKESTAL